MKLSKKLISMATAFLLTSVHTSAVHTSDKNPFDQYEKIYTPKVVKQNTALQKKLTDLGWQPDGSDLPQKSDVRSASKLANICKTFFETKTFNPSKDSLGSDGRVLIALLVTELGYNDSDEKLGKLKGLNTGVRRTNFRNALKLSAPNNNNP